MKKLKYFVQKYFFKKIFYKFTLFYFFIFYGLLAFADDDNLQGVMESVKGTFGIDSSFVKLLYLLEIVAGVYTYHKTKNIAAMLGIIFVSTFLTYALPHWVFK